MAPPSRLKILAVGGNPVSAFLSWRLNETQACDVTLVWRTAFERVSTYGIDFQSPERFGVHRWKCRDVVRSPEDAASRGTAFDYVLLCVKALPDVYDLASIIESVVTPQHTCILVNTTNTLGVEKELEQRFPTNIVLSLVSGIDITQSSAHEFVHHGPSADVWVGPANANAAIPESIQKDMADALALTLGTGEVDCHVSLNIKQQQYERMIGPVAFYPLSVLFETATHSDLMQKTGVPEMISDIIDELMKLSAVDKCTFPSDFKEKTIEKMVSTQEPSTFYNDFIAKRPLEVETYLGQPVKLGLEHQISVKRLETIYALMHHLNIVNQTRPAPQLAPQPSPTAPEQVANMPQVPASRMSAPPPGRPFMNGSGRGGRMPSGGMPPPGMRRGPPGPGYRGPPNGYPRGPQGQPSGPGQLSRRGSFDEENLDEFSHVVLYDDIPEGDAVAAYGEATPNGGPPHEGALREREYMLRQREAQLRHQEMAMRRGGGRRASVQRRMEFDDEDEDFFDPADPRMSRPRLPNPDNIDMMSLSGKKSRKTASQMELREGMLAAESRAPRANGGFRPHMGRNRASARLIHDVPGLHDSIMNDPMMGYSSDRYGAVDRKHLGDESRANSIISTRPPDFASNGGYPMPTPNRRASQSPGNPLGPNPRNGRPSPPHEGYFGPSAGPQMNGGYPPMNGNRPSPPGGMRAPAPRYPPGQGNSVQPQQVEQQAGRGEW